MNATPRTLAIASTASKENSKMTALSRPKEERRPKARAVAALIAALALCAISPAAASGAPAWELEVTAPDRAVPGETFRYGITPINVGDEATTGSMDLNVSLPAGLTGVLLEPDPKSEFAGLFPFFWSCEGMGESTIHCERPSIAEPFPGFEFPLPVQPGQPDPLSPFFLKVAVDPGASGPGTAQFEMSGGGAFSAGNASSEVRANASPEFRITEWDGEIATDEEGKLSAGSHPYDIVTDLEYSTRESAAGGPRTGAILPETGQRNLTADLPAGFVGAPAAAPTCELKDLVPSDYEPLPEEFGAGLIPSCPLNSIVGTITVRFATGEGPVRGRRVSPYAAPIFNMKPSPGEPARFGFKITGVPLELIANARTEGDLGVQLTMRNTSQGLPVIGATTTFWGLPADPGHDDYRCQYYRSELGGLPPGVHDGCKGVSGNPADGPNPWAGGSPKPFLTLPTSCNAPGEGLRFDLFVDGWAQPRQSDSASFTATDDFGNGTTGCDRVPFQPRIKVQPTTDEAETPTGLEVELTVPPDGIENPTGISQSHLKDAVVTLPEGMTVNPSQANGLAVCTPSQIGLASGDGRPIRFNRAKPSCPDASQIGEVSLKTPLLEEELTGAAYLAQQSDPSNPGTENPFNSDLALYVAIEGQGILVKLAGEVAPNPTTGQLVTRFLNNPQQPFSRFTFKFKGGQRAPLSTPPTCGTHTVEAELSPWARPDDPVTATDSFRITKGPNGGPCPSGGVPPFNPGFVAGTINNAAASYSPFLMRLTRQDGEQNLTKLSATLPPGVLGKLAGVQKCSDAALAIAKAKNGRQEFAAPSCPPGSQIGTINAGAGVGSLQVYVPGRAYLAGPYHGAPLSVAVITPAVAGPFDVGNVLVRVALDLDPKTAEVRVDGAASDPIPHILRGIPLRLRDVRVNVDRPGFTLNPTSCEESATRATLFGSFLNVIDPGDDRPVALASRFQAASCASLGFKPKLGFRLKGGTRRGAHPGLRAVYTPREGHANLSELIVRLPRSAFLEQGHIRTICTRVQFAAEACPKAAQYGYIRAWTPLLDEPLQGPVWLRSSNHKLPDLVFDLHGLVDVEVATRIDSVKGGIRAQVLNAPDAPLSRVLLTMQGGKKGLIVNSRNLCRGTNRARTKATGHNGKLSRTNPVMRPQCGKKRKRARHTRRARVVSSSALG